MNAFPPITDTVFHCCTGTETRELIVQEQERTIESLCEAIYSATLHFEKKSEINRTLAIALKRKCIAGGFDTSVVNAIENSFTENGRIFEETVVKAISDYSAQIKEISEFHIHLVSNVEQSKSKTEEESAHMLNLIFSNFRTCMRMSAQNSDTIVQSCTRYINLNHDFNTRLANALSGQLHDKKEGANLNTPNLSDMVSHWWHQNDSDKQNTH